MTKNEIKAKICGELNKAVFNAVLAGAVKKPNAGTRRQIAVHAGARGALFTVAFELSIKIEAADYLPAKLKTDPLYNWSADKTNLKAFRDAAEVLLG